MIQAPLIKQIPTIKSVPWHAAILSGSWAGDVLSNKVQWNVKLKVFSLFSSLMNVLMRMVTGIMGWDDLMSVVV